MKYTSSRTLAVGSSDPHETASMASIGKKRREVVVVLIRVVLPG